MFFKNQKNEDICILSGCDHIRFNSFVNHRIFADENNADYIFSFMINHRTKNPYLQKIEAIASLLPRFNHIFWIDDDAYFTDFRWHLADHIAAHGNVDLIICKSPVNEGRWTWISSGQFFIKRSRRSIRFLDAVLSVDPDTVREWWDTQKFGLYTGGDQDSMVYVLATDRRFKEGDFFVRVDYSEFNTREFHYESRLDEHRLVHFASNLVSKQQLMKQFIDRLGVNNFLVPDELLSKVDVSKYAEMFYAP